MANYSCTEHKVPTPQLDMLLRICTSDDTMNVNLSLTQEDPNGGYTTTFTAILQRANNYDAWAEDVMSLSGKLTSTFTSNPTLNLSFNNIAKIKSYKRI